MSKRAARESTTTTSIDQMELKSNHAIVYPLSAVDSDLAPFPGKRKTDLKRSVSLLTPRCPSDHVQVAVQRPPELPVSTLSVSLCLLCSFSRRGRFESLVCSPGWVGPQRVDEINLGSWRGTLFQDGQRWHHSGIYLVGGCGEYLFHQRRCG